ncbi:uncharacterized protein LOC116256337 [Nymphaea colorata]|uniref:Uncharacterized protein n=1 Tax=Nymphaea colorata TaxID=210225 RepID=A0A5K1EKX9_9MAGN|nr:uncharacterized protein LOC116256337 [Nymphaea colorata]
MADSNPSAEPLGQNLIKMISNACFSLFVMMVLVFTVIAITYQPPDPWLESSKAITKVFSDVENATFKQDDSVLRTGEDLNISTLAPSPSPQPITLQSVERQAEKINSSVSACADNGGITDDGFVNCSDPRVLIAIERFNLRIFSGIQFFEYQKPVNGSRPDECDVSWRFRSKKEKSWRKYRDFRRFTLRVGDNCSYYEIVKAGRWHSGKNARPVSVQKSAPVKKPHWRRSPPTSPSLTNSSSSSSVFVVEDGINDTVPNLPYQMAFRKGMKYLYYSRGGDYCKGMNHYLWSFLCALGEAQFLNRTLVMDMSICLASMYRWNGTDEEGKDFRFYFDLEHLKESVPIVEEGQFLNDWKTWNRMHKKDKVPVRKVNSYKVAPMQLKKEKSTIVWRQFDGPEPENYWYRVCDGQASKFVQRPWHAIWKSKRLMNIVSEISGRLDWDFDAVHVVRGEKAQNKELWPKLDADTSPGALLEKLKQRIQPGRKVYIATNEPFYNYFDHLRSDYKIYLLNDFSELWGVSSEWYNETRLLNRGDPVTFDGYMRVEVDTEVLYRAKKRIETFGDLTKDCKDGINTC